MVPAKAARPLVFCGVVPRGVTTAELGKALVKRFTLAELHGVQDFQAGRTEIMFKTMKAVEKMLADPTIVVGEHKCRFSYRGSMEKVVRVSSYPMDASDDQLKCTFSAFGRVAEVRRETMRAVPGLATGVRYVRLEMTTPVPNFLGVGKHVVQCEYDGVLRVCRRCNAGGHMAVDCKAVQCSRCMMFDHESETCDRACPRCGGDHPIAKCTRPSFAQALTSYRPVAPRHLNEAAVRWQMDAGKSTLDGQVWPALNEDNGKGVSGTDGASGSTSAASVGVAPHVDDVEKAPEEQGPVATLQETGAPSVDSPVAEKPAEQAARSPSPKRDWQTSLRQRSRPGKELRAHNPRGQPEEAAPGDSTGPIARYRNLSSSSSEASRCSDTLVPSSTTSASSMSIIACETCEQEQCNCAALSEVEYSST